ncbi:MAG: ribonuclease PH [Terrimicrobiaceae bacterium]
MRRHDNRSPGELRKIEIQTGIAPHAQGSVLIAFGETRVICAAMIEESVPRWMKDQGVTGGWLTAEYSMLPYSTLSRKPRDSSRGRPDGRGTEIQRLIGRSLRAVVDLEKLGSRTLWVDCDVLQADGGTRTAAITGAAVAIELACQSLVKQGKLATLPIKNRVAAISVGIVGGEVLVDLDYHEDKDAEVDMNIVMTDKMDFVEVQGSGEESVFSAAQLELMVTAARSGIANLLEIQNAALSNP